MIIRKKQRPKKIKTKDLRPSKLEFVTKVIDGAPYRYGFLFKLEIISGPLKGTQFTKEFQKYGDPYKKLLDAVGIAHKFDDDENYIDKIINRLFVMELKPTKFIQIDNFETFKRMKAPHVQVVKTGPTKRN